LSRRKTTVFFPGAWIALEEGGNKNAGKG